VRIYAEPFGGLTGPSLSLGADTFAILFSVFMKSRTSKVSLCCPVEFEIALWDTPGWAKK